MTADASDADDVAGCDDDDDSDDVLRYKNQGSYPLASVLTCVFREKIRRSGAAVERSVCYLDRQSDTQASHAANRQSI